MDESTANDICRHLGFVQTRNLGDYLGSKVIHDQIGKETFKGIVDKVNAKLYGQKAQNLPLAGCVTHVKSALQPFSIYPMLMAKFPIYTCQAIYKLIRNFVRGSNANKRDKYNNGQHPGNSIKAKAGCSNIWRGICHVQSNVMEGEDNWLEDGQWNWDIFQSLLPNYMRLRLTVVIPPLKVMKKILLCRTLARAPSPRFQHMTCFKERIIRMMVPYRIKSRNGKGRRDLGPFFGCLLRISCLQMIFVTKGKFFHLIGALGVGSMSKLLSMPFEIAKYFEQELKTWLHNNLARRGVLRDCKGGWLMGFMYPLAIVPPLMQNCGNGFRHATLEIDSLLGVGYIYDSRAIHGLAKEIMRRIQELMSREWEVRCQHIHR
ncbi:conserved hypothetical protein [Ricinus communis]|uniref:Uncharacterized protein n=1 Tax=Ricinus communis TaxID=3988 RepID=B9T2J4_RICCO|nr:conserved hypothetical protein [Ricinus communis]